MQNIKKYFMTLALLLTAVTGAWAQAPTIYFQQDYATETVDWSTATGGRFTPIVENGYLTVNQNQRNNNGTTLTSTATQGKVDAGKDFTMTFNVKLGASTQQTATAFNIYDAANSAPILSFAEGSAGATAWKINGGTQTATVSAGGGKSLNELSWIFVQVTFIAGENAKTYLTLKDDQNNIIDGFDKTEIPTNSVAGGLGKMTFVTSRYSANFAIDNVLVRDVEPEPTEWSLTPDETGKTWTLAKMPASNIELQVEYYAESNLFLGKEALADKANITVKNGETTVEFGDDGKSTTTVTEGTPMTVKFNGTKKVLGVKVEKKADNAYQKWNADQKKLVATEIPTTATKVESSVTMWKAGTYVVEGEVTINGTIALTGDVELIIKDGAKLTAQGISGYSNNLSIYGQAQMTGELVVSSDDDAISTLPTLEVHSAKVTATSSGNNHSGFSNIGTFNVYGGLVDAKATGAGNGIGLKPSGSLNIYGGEVKAEGKGDGNYYGILCGSSVNKATLTVYGGQLWAGNADKQALNNITLTIDKSLGFNGEIESSSDNSTWNPTVGTPDSKYVRVGY